MNTITKGVFKSTTPIIAAIAASLASVAYAQDSLQFTGVKATDERAVQLRWQSISNAVYRLEYAPELSSEIVWNTLVDFFPAQGTNTMFLDTGKYWTEPALPNPKDSSQRFYRLVQVDTNTLPAPVVTITNLTAGTNVSGEVEIGVHVSTTNSITFVRYYVDGEEVQLGSADEDGNSSYTINTTEWPNGSHEIFVVAETTSGTTTTGTVVDEQNGAGTSAIIPVTFDNWISKWYFSLPGFDPSLGETQRITAVFAAYSCWTLQIVDEFDTTVRTVAGSGDSMAFDWDGTDDNGFDTINGTFNFILSAEQCTPLASEMSSEAASIAIVEETPQLLAWSGSGSVVPLALYPPGIDTNGFTIFEGFMSDFMPKASLESSSIQSSEIDGPVTQAATSPQSTQRPRRPAPKPIKGSPGKFGVAWQGHHPDPGTNGIAGFNRPANLSGSIQLDPNYVLPYGPIKRAKNIAAGFETTLSKYKWKKAFHYGDDQLTAALLRKPSKGGSNVFNNCNLGLLIGHGMRCSPFVRPMEAVFRLRF